jgi:GT2 family glycosyltransferase
MIRPAVGQGSHYRSAMPPAVSVVIVAYDNGDELVEAVRSVVEHGDGAEIVVVVNGDAKAVVPKLVGGEGVLVVEPGQNLGFAGGCNLGVAKAGGDVILFLNPDAVVRPGAVGALARAADEPGVGLVMPRLLLRDEPERLNSAGGAIHVCGQGWASWYGRPAAELTVRRSVAAASGAAMAVRRDTFFALGGFLEEMFVYHEDAELSWRARLRGLDVIVIPDADVLHAYEFARHPAKLELLERNRLLFVTTCYGGRLLMFLAPVLLAYELAVVALAGREGWLAAKWRGWRWCWTHRRWLARRRAEVQAGRLLPDRAVAAFLTPVLDPGQLELPRAVAAVNTALSLYWRVVQRLL